jgi:hypothetical protein
MTKKSAILDGPGDFLFPGFSSKSYPLGNVGSAKTVLYCRNLMNEIPHRQCPKDPKGRAYQNLVALFRAMLFFRALEPTARFWSIIVKGLGFEKNVNLEQIADYYINARVEFLNSRAPMNDNGILTMLVDKWRLRPRVALETQLQSCPFEAVAAYTAECHDL